MPQFFSSTPVDYGAGYISNAGQNAAGQIAAFGRQRDADQQEQEQIKLRARVAAQAQEDAVQRQLDNQVLSRWQAVKGNAPVPMMKGVDGKDRIDRAVANGLLTDLETAADAKKSATIFTADTNAKKQLADADWDAAHPVTGTSPYSNMTPDQRRLAQKQQDVFDQKATIKQDSSDIELAKQRAALNAAAVDKFGSLFGRAPQAGEVDANGVLTPVAMNALYKATNLREKGFMDDPNKPGAIMPIPGGAEDMKMKANQEKLDASKQATAAKNQMLEDTHAALLDNIGTALGQVGGTTAGNVAGSSFARHIPLLGQGAEDLHSNLEAIKSGLGVDTLNAMRASSPSGNTGIGRIMQVEFEAFAKSARNLDQTQSPDQLRKNLTDLQTHLQNWKQAKAAADAQAPAGTPAAASGKSFKVLSVTPIN